MPKTIIFGECHPDPITRILVGDNLSYLKSRGYSHVGFVHDNDKTIDFEINSLRLHIDIIETRLKDSSLKELIKAEPQNEYTLLSYKSDKKLLALLHNIKQQEMTYYGLDIAKVGDRFAPNLSRTELVAKLVDEENIMQQRENTMTERLLHTFRANHASINIVGAIHIPGIQEFLIKKLGKKTVEDNFVFIIPDSVYYLENNQQFQQGFIDTLDKCPLRTIRLLFNPDIQSTFQKVLTNFCFDDEILQEPNESEETNKTNCCCGLINFMFNFFKRPEISENSRANVNALSYKKIS